MIRGRYHTEAGLLCGIKADRVPSVPHYDGPEPLIGRFDVREPGPYYARINAMLRAKYRNHDKE